LVHIYKDRANLFQIKAMPVTVLIFFTSRFPSQFRVRTPSHAMIAIQEGEKMPHFIRQPVCSTGSMKRNLFFPLAALGFALLLASCSAERKTLRKASNAVDRMEYDEALAQYDKLVQKDHNSFYGNAGKGIVLSEFLARHEQAIPYLEKAVANSPK